MLEMINYGATVRTTHATKANDTSSRSHAVCTISIMEDKGRGPEPHGKLLLVDLAGSERACDTQSNNKDRRAEGAEINMSLLALKECIRSMETCGAHVPFRQNKLTMVLRDSFMGGIDKSRIIMIACVSPGTSSADHTLNTLRYSERLKDRPGKENVVSRFMSKGGKEVALRKMTSTVEHHDKLLEPDYAKLEEEVKDDDPLLEADENDLLTSEFDEDMMDVEEPVYEKRPKQPRLAKSKTTAAKSSIPKFSRPQTAQVQNR